MASLDFTLRQPDALQNHAKSCPPGTELEREKGKSISFSISNILSKEQQQQQQQMAEQSDIEESDDEEGCDDDSEPPDPEHEAVDHEDIKDRLKLDPSLVHLPTHLGLTPESSALLQGAAAAGLSDPLKSYLSAAYSSYSTAVSSVTDQLTGTNPLMAGLGLPAVAGEAGRNVIKVPAHRPATLPLPLDYSAAPWLYRPTAISGLPSYLPLPSSLLLNRFGAVPFPPRRIGHPYQNRTPPKRKKPRTSFSRLQICELEKRFHKQKYLASTERAQMAKNLKMTDAQVKTWFQNRRTKWRRQTAEEREQERQAAAKYFLSMQMSGLDSDSPPSPPPHMVGATHSPSPPPSPGPSPHHQDSHPQSLNALESLKPWSDPSQPGSK